MAYLGSSKCCAQWNSGIWKDDNQLLGDCQSQFHRNQLRILVSFEMALHIFLSAIFCFTIPNRPLSFNVVDWPIVLALPKEEGRYRVYNLLAIP